MGTKSNREQIDLTGRCGVLGFHHPVAMKSLLKAFLHGKANSTAEELKSFLDELKGFLSRFISEEFELSLTSEYSEEYVGRTPNFFTESQISQLNRDKKITFSQIFPFSLTLSFLPPKSSSLGFNLSRADLEVAKGTLRFLRDGGFYGDNGLIKNREKEIQQYFSDCKFYESTDGLILKTKTKLQSTKVLKLHNDALVFPLSFDREILEIIKQELEV